MSKNNLVEILKATAETLEKNKPDVSCLCSKSGLYLDHIQDLLGSYLSDDHRKVFSDDGSREVKGVLLHTDDINLLFWLLEDLATTWQEIAEECKDVALF